MGEKGREGSGEQIGILREDLDRFRGQLRGGSIQRAYHALLSYMMGLRAHFMKKYPTYGVSGLYQGFMDMTYFAVFPPSLKQRDLKIAIVFNYEAFRLEAWLAGSNRKIQRKYRELIANSQWNEYRVVTPGKGVDSIVECDLVEDFNLDDMEDLTAAVEANVRKFIDRIESHLSVHDPV